MNHIVTLHRAGHEPEPVLVYSLPEASEAVLAYQRKHGMASSDMGEHHGDVTTHGVMTHDVSYNGRVWGMDDEGDYCVLEHEPTNID